MASFPRLLPLAAVAVGGVLAVKLVMGVGGLPDLLSGARALAEGTGTTTNAASAPAAPGAATNSAIANRPAPVCAPTAAELARAAGLSPAELQVLQNLGARRGQLDQREQGLDTQVQLLAAAEARVNQRIAAMQALQGQIQGLVGQVDQRRQEEIARMAAIYTAMRPRDSAPRFVLLSDEVRLPIAQAMRPRSLSAMMAQMPPAEAQRLTESLARRYGDNAALAAARSGNAGNTAAAPAAPAAPGAAPPPNQTAAATPPPAQAAAGAPGQTPAANPPAANPAAPAVRPPQAARPPRARPPQRANRPANAAAPPTAGAAAAATPPAPGAQRPASTPAGPPANAAARPPAPASATAPAPQAGAASAAAPPAQRPASAPATASPPPAASAPPPAPSPGATG